MVMTDPIADFLTRIRNANMARHESLELPASKIKKNLSKQNNLAVHRIQFGKYYWGD